MPNSSGVQILYIRVYLSIVYRGTFTESFAESRRGLWGCSRKKNKSKWTIIIYTGCAYNMTQVFRAHCGDCSARTIRGTWFPRTCSATKKHCTPTWPFFPAVPNQRRFEWWPFLYILLRSLITRKDKAYLYESYPYFTNYLLFFFFLNYKKCISYNWGKHVRKRFKRSSSLFKCNVINRFITVNYEYNTRYPSGI